MKAKHQTVLCVDDDPDDQLMVLDAILEIDPSLRVASALNDMEAMSFLNGAKGRKELPCLVLMDLNVPLMDGRQTLSLLKKDEELNGVPLVLFTTSLPGQDNYFAGLPGVAFISKPLNQGALHDTIRRLLSRWP